MNGLSLFSGAGIGELAFKYILPDYRTVGYVDNDKYCQAVLRARIRDGVLDDAPIFGDIREFNTRYASFYAGKVDWLSAGFPCQPFSVAGRQLGEADERNQWPATRDAISIIRPEYIFLENVPALISSGYFTTILSDLVEIGFDCEWDVVPAAFVGALHLRERLWILAHTQGARVGGLPARSGSERARAADPNWHGKVVSYADGPGLSESTCARLGCLPSQTEPSSRCELSRRIAKTGTHWTIEPDVGRVVHGGAHRVDRIKALGNGWVPQVVKRVLQVNP